MPISKYKKGIQRRQKDFEAWKSVIFKLQLKKLYRIPLVKKIGINIFVVIFLEKNFTYWA